MADNNSSVKSSISPQKPLFNISNSAKIRKDAFIFSNGDRYEGEYVVTDEGQLMLMNNLFMMVRGIAIKCKEMAD